MLQLRVAASDADIAAVRRLMRAYQASLQIDLCFQDFASELHALPGAYATPSGRLVIACIDGAPVGCVALRPLSARRCEMKRLFVDPLARASGTGRALAIHIIAEATAIGYDDIVLDVLPTFTAALRLYAALGFLPTTPYCGNPVPGTQWMRLALRPTARSAAGPPI